MTTISRITFKLTHAQFDKLRPFLERKHPRARVLLYLMALGVDIPTLIDMTIGDLRELSLPSDVAMYRDIELDKLKGNKSDDRWCVYPNGTPFKYDDFMKVLSHACVKTLGRRVSQKEFSRLIRE
ncbi:MAG: hypothetical protein AABY83_15315 [Pseudomonadota bacterium]